MQKTVSRVLQGIMCLTLLPLSAVALSGQSPAVLIVTPDKATMLIGESRTFRLVDQNGQMQRHVSWSISDDDAFQTEESDELTITAKQAGDFRIRARSANGGADATVKVMEGATLPVGTVKWSAGATKGCKTTKIIPAVPSANGPDIFEQSQCEDGQYMAAYTVDGVQLWRRKVGGPGAPAVAETDKNAVAASRLNAHPTSVCDSVSIGTDQQKVRDLLNQRSLSFTEGVPGERVWIIEESNTQCKLWFDEKSVLARKRKIFIAE